MEKGLRRIGWQGWGGLWWQSQCFDIALVLVVGRMMKDLKNNKVTNSLDELAGQI